MEETLLAGLARGLDSATRKALPAVAAAVRAAGGRALVAGGAVRDALLARPARDVDVEVFGLSPEELARAVAPVARVSPVGAAFEVLLVRGLALELSVPRAPDGRVGTARDPAGGYGEPIAAAAARRDFTLNALYLDPLTGELVDPCGGAADLAARRLRHSSARFAEDPLRVLRGMQLVARFALAPAPETVALCRTLTPAGLAVERIFEEWRKLLLEGVEIGRGLAFLEATGWLAHLPELAALVGCPQPPDRHPEGDVWTHTRHAVDAFARERTGDERDDLVVGLAVLCHDLGKPATTRGEGLAVTAPGHEEAGEGPTRSLLGRLTRESALVEAVVPLVREHRRLVLLARAPDDAALRRLAVRAGRLDRLLRVARADRAGRPPLVFDGFPEGDALLARARELGIDRAPPAPLVLGRHLLALGLPPGPGLGRLLAALYERQLDGEFTTAEEGIELARRWPDLGGG